MLQSLRVTRIGGRPSKNTSVRISCFRLFRTNIDAEARGRYRAGTKIIRMLPRLAAQQDSAILPKCRNEDGSTMAWWQRGHG
jgi:hypothetical protein